MTLETDPFQRYNKVTRREAFLREMERIVPWKRLFNIIKPHYPKGEHGRPPIGIERMLRIYFLQQWFNLSDPAAEEALYDSRSMRAFARIDLGQEPVPDETTICKFRHLIEEHDLGKKMLKEINRHLQESGVKIAGGTIVDASIIAAPSSTKNQDGERDPEMHQTKKGNQWYFGMKMHIGIDSAEKIVHSVATTAANVHDSQVLPQLLHGNETRVWGDSAYRGQREAMRNVAPKARDFTNTRAYRGKALSRAERRKNRRKSSIRSRVEHVFSVIKGVFGFRKVRYRGLAKNTNAINVLCALANLFVQKRRLLHFSGA